MDSQLLLAADIGGTKSDLALFQPAVSCSLPLVQKSYVNARFSGIEQVVESFLAECDHIPRSACLAVAGVVTGERVRMTNLSWEIDCLRLQKKFGFDKAVIINDLTAVCSSLPLLGTVDLLEIQAGQGTAGNIRAVVAPGTGLGEGLLVTVKGQHVACGSEGGHVDFAPVDEEQIELLNWMLKRAKPVSYEMLIAGPGLASLYDFCRDYYKISESPWILQAMAQSVDRIPVIVKGALATSPCPLCSRVLELFLSILGSEAGNLALKVYATGGIYIGGGIIPRLVGRVSFAGFLKNFSNKGQMVDLLSAIPISVILKRDAALMGAARFGHDMFFASEDDG